MALMYSGCVGKGLYNRTAIVPDETIFLLYRAQEANLTSSIGLAWLTDGYNFTHPRSAGLTISKSQNSSHPYTSRRRVQ